MGVEYLSPAPDQDGQHTETERGGQPIDVAPATGGGTAARGAQVKTAIGDVKVGDTVTVVAIVSGTTATAKTVTDSALRAASDNGQGR